MFWYERSSYNGQNLGLPQFSTTVLTLTTTIQHLYARNIIILLGQAKMAQLLQPPSVFDFTPPPSPTRFSSPMKWLTRTPTSVPLPPSPAKSQDGSDDSKSCSSTEYPTITQSNFSKAMRSLQKKSSTFSLQPKLSCSSLAATPPGTPQREIANWFSKPSPVRVVTPAPLAADLGDHFARSLPTYEEKQGELRRRKEAAQRRVKSMRTYLGAKAKEETATVRHQRYDSGSHEHADSFALRELQNCTTNTPKTSEEEARGEDQAPASLLLDLNFLRHALCRLQRPPLQFHCVGCKETHRSSLPDEGEVVWLLQSCRHYMHSECFGELLIPDTDGCFHCTHFKMMLRKLGKDEVVARHKDVLKQTSRDGYVSRCM
jgi:hypothetical protein